MNEGRKQEIAVFFLLCVRVARLEYYDCVMRAKCWR